MDKDIVYFINDGSPESQKVRMYLDIKNITYTEIDYDTMDDEAKGQLTNRPPVVIFEQRAIYGFDGDELNKMFDK